MSECPKKLVSKGAKGEESKRGMRKLEKK